VIWYNNHKEHKVQEKGTYSRSCILRTFFASYAKTFCISIFFCYDEGIKEKENRVMKKALYMILGIILLGIAFVFGRYSVKDQNVQTIDLYSSGKVELLNFSTEEDVETSKFERFLELQEVLIEAHNLLSLKRETFKENRLEIQDLRSSMRENKLRPSFEDGITLWTNYHALIDIKDAFDETSGEGYQKLKDLKGYYSLEHIDLIIETYEAVLEVFTIRQGLYDQAIMIFIDSATLYQTYLNE
jgi:hypothetical protein